MIDDEQVRPLIEALELDDDPAHHRLLVDALTALPLSTSAWRVAAPMVHRALALHRTEGGLAPDLVRLAARIPLQSVRHGLRTGAQDSDSPRALSHALALAEVGDVAGVPTLVRQLQVLPSEAVARALAILPLDQSMVSVADLSPGLRTGDGGSDDATRMWTAIALARLGTSRPWRSCGTRWCARRSSSPARHGVISFVSRHRSSTATHRIS